MNFAEMTVTDLCGWIFGGIVALSAIIQISPIKLNPWSWIAKKVGKAVNQEVIDKVDKMEIDLKNMRAKMDENNAKNARTKILRFGDELMHGVKHSKDSFDDILNTITEYDRYCLEHKDFKNRVTESTVRHIQGVYDKCMEGHSFL